MTRSTFNELRTLAKLHRPIHYWGAESSSRIDSKKMLSPIAGVIYLDEVKHKIIELPSDIKSILRLTIFRLAYYCPKSAAILLS